VKSFRDTARKISVSFKNHGTQPQVEVGNLFRELRDADKP
jgi:hypothetical protein